MNYDYIAQNIKQVQNNIREAAERSGRDVSAIKLMAVTKTRTTDEIIAAYNAGIRLFGENRVQELEQKFSRASDGTLLCANTPLKDAQLHLIGHLQRNKVARILGVVDAIQSVDSLTLLEKLLAGITSSRQCDLFIEVHTGEESKAGFRDIESIADVITKMQDCSVSLSGFMTMAPFTADINAIRTSFRQLVSVSKKIQHVFPQFQHIELSMGMSSDYAIAVAEGSTLVRVGTALFAPEDR